MAKMLPFPEIADPLPNLPPQLMNKILHARYQIIRAVTGYNTQYMYVVSTPHDPSNPDQIDRVAYAQHTLPTLLKEVENRIADYNEIVQHGEIQTQRDASPDISIMARNHLPVLESNLYQSRISVQAQSLLDINNYIAMLATAINANPNDEICSRLYQGAMTERLHIFREICECAEAACHP